MKIPIFIASTEYDLRDLRAELAAYLEELGADALLSSKKGFPDFAGVPPYAQCVRMLERALIVIGIIDRRYGKALNEWGPFPEYAGLSPTHAELRHALRKQKRLVVYVQSDVQAFYEMYRKNKKQFENLKQPHGLEPKVLELFTELKLAKPAPWIESFRDVRDIKDSLRKRLLADLYDALLQREKLVAIGAPTLIDVVLALEPEKRARLVKDLTNIPVAEAKRIAQYLARRERPTRQRVAVRTITEWMNVLASAAGLAVGTKPTVRPSRGIRRDSLLIRDKRTGDSRAPRMTSNKALEPPAVRPGAMSRGKGGFGRGGGSALGR